MFAASGAVLPENESLRTVIWAAIIVSIRVRCGVVSVWSETTWKTVGTVTVPFPRYGESLRTP